MGKGKRGTKRGRGARSSSPATRGGRGGRGREGHDGGGGRQSRGRADGGGDCSSPSSGQSGSVDRGLGTSTPPSTTTTPPRPGAPPSILTTPPSAGAPPCILGSPPDENYATRVTTSREERAAHLFFEFLQKYMGSSVGDPVYVAELKSMRAKKLWKLQIQFRHLRMFDRNFSHYVCNNRRRIWDWLLSAVRKFLFAHCVIADGMTSDVINSTTNDIVLRAELEFMRIPNRIQTLPIFLKSNSDDLSEFMNIGFETGESILVSTAIGGNTCQACVQHLIERHIQGHSWNGDFTAEDWDVINGCEVELMKQPVSFSPEFGAADLGKIDSELLHHYRKIDKDGNQHLPLYFDELHDDLTVTSQSVKSEQDLLWYREYIISHPALKPPMARIHLIRGLFREIRTYNLSADPIFHDFLTKASESCYVDWRSLITNGKSYVLLEAYWHKIPKADRDKQGNQLMKTSAEAEVFPASKMAKFLPFFIKNLLMKCNMSGCLREVWQEYKSSGFKSQLGIRKA